LIVAPDVCVHVEVEMRDFQEQLKQMLKDLAKEKEKDVEQPVPPMNQVHTIKQLIQSGIY
jgi:hypothetical protein